MSQENEELACRFFYALQRRDYDAVRACVHPAAEWHNTAAFPSRRTVTGPKQILEFWQDLTESFAKGDAGAEVEHVKSKGNIVVIGVRSWGRSATAGLPIDVRWSLTLGVRAGRIERADVRGDYQRALEAAGLSE
jgi:ketosteroid isomerase-like protein